MDLTIDAEWVIGVLLASIRVGGFVAASPIFGRAIPSIGRIGLVLVLGFTFAQPPETELELWTLLGAAGMNAIVGVVLGILTGIIFTLFMVAGGLIDFTSGLSSAQAFDPITQDQNPIFGRFFNLMAVALFLLLGGDGLLVAGLRTSFDAVGVSGAIDMGPGMAEIAVDLLTSMTIASIELAMPALAALFLTEVVLGIAARFAPQANVFLLGLPAKIGVAFASVGAVVLLVPETMDGVLHIIEDTFQTAVRAL